MFMFTPPQTKFQCVPLDCKISIHGTFFRLFIPLGLNLLQAVLAHKGAIKGLSEINIIHACSKLLKVQASVFPEDGRAAFRTLPE